MAVEISGYVPEQQEAIKVAANGQWPFEDWHEGEEPTELNACGQSSLYGGEGEEEFAERLVAAIWKANGAYCSVHVMATYLENLPFDDYCFDESDYARLIGQYQEGKE